MEKIQTESSIGFIPFETIISWFLPLSSWEIFFGVQYFPERKVCNLASQKSFGEKFSLKTVWNPIKENQTFDPNAIECNPMVLMPFGCLRPIKSECSFDNRLWTATDDQFRLGQSPGSLSNDRIRLGNAIERAERRRLCSQQFEQFSNTLEGA